MKQDETTIQELIQEAFDDEAKRKRDQSVSCEHGEHGIYLEHFGFGGGMIHYRCRHCGRSVSKPDTPMTI